MNTSPPARPPARGTRGRMRLAGAVLALAAATAACSSAPAGDPAATTGTGTTVLRVVAAGSPTASTLDPHGSFVNEADAVRSALVYDSLTRPDGAGGTQPALAESWEPDPDLRTWTVTLREGVMFSDGRPVRAADALYSLQRIGRKAAENFGRLAEIDTAASSAPDDRTLRLVLRAPNAGLPQALEAVSMVVPEGTDDFSSPVPGSGPFVLTSIDAQTTVLTRNDSWWGPRPPSETIELRAVPDIQARAAAVTSGQADFAGSVSPAAARSAEQTGQAQVVRRPGVTLYPLVMRLDTAPFDRAQVREAVKLAVDRDQLVQTVFLGLGTVGDDVLSPDVGPGVEQRTVTSPAPGPCSPRPASPTGSTSSCAAPRCTRGWTPRPRSRAQQLAEAGIRVQVVLEPRTPLRHRLRQRAVLRQLLRRHPVHRPRAGRAGVGLSADETAWRPPEWDVGFAAALSTPDDAQRAARLGELQRQIQIDGG